MLKLFVLILTVWFSSNCYSKQPGSVTSPTQHQTIDPGVEKEISFHPVIGDNYTPASLFPNSTGSLYILLQVSPQQDHKGLNTWIFIVIILVVLSVGIYGLFRLRFVLLSNQKKWLEEKVRERTAELSDLNTLLEEKQEEISLQNEELNRYRTSLEKQVEERTEAMKKALQRAEEADKLKSAFLANMSHEIRTPMNAIAGFATLLNREVIEEEERKEFTEIIINNCNTLMVLINDILEVSLIEANQIEIKSEPVHVFGVFEELESYFRMNNNKSLDISFDKTGSPKDLVIRNDVTRLRQIFNNLLNNAYKYTEEGYIKFGYSLVDGKVRFYVSDTGIGIAESEYQNIFNFFHKIDKKGNQFYRGAGIGLSISNKLAELMGGRIWLASDPGKGTTFFVEFDASADLKTGQTLEGENPEKNREIPDLSKMAIIIAEDETANYRLFEKILNKTGAKLIWAKNGMEAVEAVKNLTGTQKCLVIMDIKMPVMSGIRAAEMIGRFNPQIPIIAVTAYARTENREEILKENFVDYIAKPIDPARLIDAVAEQASGSER